MIFVTVGTCSFDKLVAAVDRLCATGRIHDRVVCQIGSGKYVPEHCEYFRREPTLERFYEQADLIVCHGGTGTIGEVLAARKPFVAVANEDLSGNHQADFLTACEPVFRILWCRDIRNLEAAIRAAPLHKSRLVVRQHLATDVDAYLRSLRGMSSKGAL